MDHLDPFEDLSLEPSRGRAWRRHQRARLKAARKHYWNGWRSDPSASSRLVKTPTPCSCAMCGNPRKYFGEPTLQEQRADQDHQEASHRRKHLAARGVDPADPGSGSDGLSLG